MEKNQRQSMSRLNFWLISIAAAVMVLAAVIQYFVMRNSMFQEAELHAKSELMISKQKIETAVTNVESAVNSTTSAVANITNVPDGLYELTRKMLVDNAFLSSSVVAYKPGYWAELDSAYAVCSYKDGPNILRKRLPDDFFTEGWYIKGLQSKTSFWDEPFMFEGKMTARCVAPVKDRRGQTFALLMATIPTDSLTKDIKGLPAYPNSYAKLISDKGHKIVGPNESIQEGDALHFTEPVGDIGWKLTVVCPRSDIGNNILSGRLIVLGLMCLGILLLAFIVFNSLRNLKTLKTTTEEKVRMGGELEQARDVQNAMVLSQPEDLPQRDNLNISVGHIYKSEIGGDFYDCFIEGDLLYLCIGDVAGSGAPAALTMAMTLSAFRTATLHNSEPAMLMKDINTAICRQKEKLTVKFLCATLNLQDGELRYCNAGMHAPIQLTENSNWEIEVDKNPRIGVSKDSTFTEQKKHLINENVLFFYTDELTAARNSKGEEWGDKRLQALLQSSFRTNAKALVSSIHKAITQHTDGTPLHDDITMLAVKYTL